MSIQAKIDFEEKLSELTDEGYLEEYKPILDTSKKYSNLCKHIKPL